MAGLVASPIVREAFQSAHGWSGVAGLFAKAIVPLRFQPTDRWSSMAGLPAGNLFREEFQSASCGSVVACFLTTGVV